MATECSMTYYLSEALAKHVTQNIPFTSPTENWLACFTADPTKDGLLTNEITLGGYLRQQVTWSDPEVDAEDGKMKQSNVSDIEFPQATANWDGKVTHGGIMDADETGNMLFKGELEVHKTITEDDIFRIPAGELQLIWDIPEEEGAS